MPLFVNIKLKNENSLLLTYLHRNVNNLEFELKISSRVHEGNPMYFLTTCLWHLPIKKWSWILPLIIYVYKSTCFPANQDNLVLEFYTQSVTCRLIWASINRLGNGRTLFDSLSWNGCLGPIHWITSELSKVKANIKRITSVLSI
jgi:hypothetical protein